MSPSITPDDLDKLRDLIDANPLRGPVLQGMDIPDTPEYSTQEEVMAVVAAQIRRVTQDYVDAAFTPERQEQIAALSQETLVELQHRAQYLPPGTLSDITEDR